MLGDQAVWQVLIQKAGSAGLLFNNTDVVDFAVGILAQKRRLSNFGNAGAVVSMLNVAKVCKLYYCFFLYIIQFP
jgi:hypothetical protein